MKLSPASTAIVRNARLAAVGGMVAIFVSVSVSACSDSRPPSGSPTFSPGGTSSPTATVTPTTTVTPTSTVVPTTPPASPSPSPSPSLAPSPTPSAVTTTTSSPIPTVAPATGGGGTAGFQDALLLTVGAAAILAGAGSLAYRRRLIRNRQ